MPRNLYSDINDFDNWKRYKICRKIRKNRNSIDNYVSVYTFCCKAQGNASYFSCKAVFFFFIR